MRRPLALLALAGLAACGGGPEPEAPRSVVLISVDTLRADALGAYTPGLGTSPHFDALAAEGWLFEQAGATAPSTLPSHASLLTGLDPYAHGVRANAGYALAPDRTTLAEAFAAAGYRTGAEVAATVIARRTGLDQGFDHYRDPDASDARHKSLGGGGTRVADERPASDISDRGIEFLRRHAGEPFFLWLHYFDPHVEYAAPPQFARRHPGRPYHAEVAYADAEIGRLVEALRELGLAPHTLVAITSDHGEGLGDHGETTHSFLAYQSTLHVPLLFWGPPDIPRGVRVATPVSLVDVAPTLLAWAGLPPLAGARGRPLQQLDAEAAPREVYAETFEARSAFGASALRTLRRGDWKYLHKTEPELYDLGTDPGELRDLAGAWPERVEALRGALGALLETAPTPSAASEVELDPEVAAQLAALGYAAAPPAAPDDDTLALEGADPRALLDDFQRLGEAGRVLYVERDPERAAALYAALAAEHPDGVLVLRGWIDALRELGRWPEQLPLLERAVSLVPADNALRLKYVEALEAAGDRAGALREARQAHAVRPCGELEIAYLSRTLRGVGQLEAQRDALREALARCRSDGARNELAWLLATSPEARLRDGAEALRLARELVARPGQARPEFLDTLAAALAESGDFAEAARVQRRAVAQLVARNAPAAALEVFRAHLAAFEAGRPVRDPEPGG